MSLSISANQLRTLERKYNAGKSLDAAARQRLNHHLNDITDEELKQSLMRHMDGWVAVQAGDLEKFDTDPELGSKIERYILESFAKAKFPELWKEHQAKQPPEA